jgi:hypothetical protein
MKLLDILLEILRESKPITLSKEVFPQMDHLWKNYSIASYEMRSKGEEGKDVLIGSIKMKHPYKPGEKLEVPVYAEYTNLRRWAMFSPDDNKIFINSKYTEDKEDFIHSLHHELIHSVDPKIGKIKTVDPRSNNTARGNDLYTMSPTEFDAETSTYIPLLSRNLKKLDKEKQELFKTSLKKFINDLLSRNLEFKSDDYSNDVLVDYEDLLSLFDSNVSKVNFSNLTKALYQYDDKSKIKKFIQRLSTLL